MNQPNEAPCTTCGNVYDKAFRITSHDGATGVFDSIECAAAWVAPECVHCGTRILGHGVQAGTDIYCCAHCARAAGDEGLTDRTGAERSMVG
jgi:hypothetical protein